ncbi:MATE family efflux transporter [Desulfobaculum bizertense]|uniref:Putative efflux protein, MATE family n=1 Tax=Desulfobaculum bizertense DSM 18034 TaxID=1121442 RepID=A0A1T4VKM7_9BACT|nr:MATE family efflux transporter [Desulfobaculum bizertense]UIJ38075.1 MATE family efflux transporter [Desulfobaculum bizertense]SKA65445.1 putative efflux protein, MATE family [Desulfobaculum bizertense DSM 18034]
MADDSLLLTQQPIPQLIRKIATPASVGFFFQTMFNITDTYFAGLISTNAVAALSLSFPVFFIVISLSSGLQTGATALIATAIGSRDMKDARELARQAVIFGGLVAFLVSVIGYFASPFFFGLLGASGEYLEDCLLYMQPIFIGAVFFVLNGIFNAALNATGDTKTFRNVLIVGSLANVGLDPWFIYGGFGIPAMGITGIALSTVLTQAVQMIYLAYRAKQTGLLQDFLTPRGYTPHPATLTRIFKQGFPASMNMVTVGLGIFIITYFISIFGKEAVAGYGVATRVEQIILMPTIGLNVAVLSLTAQNHGAGLDERIRETLHKVLVYGAWLMVGGVIIIYTLAEQLIALFTPDPAVVAAGSQYLHVAALTLYSYVVLYSHTSCMQGLKCPMFAVWIGLFRQIIAPALVFWTCTSVLGLGLNSIWWGIFAVTWVAALYAFWYCRKILRNLPTEKICIK